MTADTGRQATRADVYREVAALVNDLPPRYRPQDVAALLHESAAQIDAEAGREATLYRPTWWVEWCLPCDDNDHARCASYDPTYDCDCAGEGHPDLVPRTMSPPAREAT